MRGEVGAEFPRTGEGGVQGRLGIGGRGDGAPGGYGLAVLLIGVGLVLLGRRLLTARRP